MGRNRSWTAGAVAAVVAAGALTGCQPAQPWDRELVSVNAAGTDAGDDASYFPVLSPDGTKVAVHSWASDLGPTDTNGEGDVYLFDLVTGDVTLVSANAAGTDAGNGASATPVFSGDGTKIAFLSYAGDLGPADAGFDPDVYVRDLVTGDIELATVNAAGTDGGNSDSSGNIDYDLDHDGSRVAFLTEAGDLGPQDSPRPSGDEDIYVRDLDTGTTTLVSVNMAGTDRASSFSSGPDISPDGTKVAFISPAPDLVPDDGPTGIDAFVRDLTAGTTRAVSVTPDGRPSGGANSVAFSPDGTRVAFDDAGNLLAGEDGYGDVDVYVHDLGDGSLSLVSREVGAPQNSGTSSTPVWSPDGTRIAFTSFATNFGATDVNGVADVYVADLASGVVTLVSAVSGTDDTGPAAEAGASVEPSFSADGTRIAFTSLASNLGPKDSPRPFPGGVEDVYVRDLATRATTLVSGNPEGTDSARAGRSQTASITPDGSRVVYMSQSGRQGPTDTNLDWDVYLGELHGADLTVTLDATSDLTYEVGIANRGPDPAEDVDLVLLLPDGVHVKGTASTPAVSCIEPTPAEPQVMRCHLDDLPTGVTQPVYVVTDVTAPAGTPLTAIAAVGSPTRDPAGHDNNATLTVTAGG